MDETLNIQRQAG